MTWNADQTAFGSNDNASYWQGYLGYPIVAVLMALGRVEYSTEVARKLSIVPWKKLNDAAKRDYAGVVDGVLRNLGEADAESIRSKVARIATLLDGLTLERLGSASRPPTGPRKTPSPTT